jgi:hypothetical protein
VIAYIPASIWKMMLADASPDAMVSLPALAAFIVAVLGAVAAFLARKKGKEEGREEEKQRHVSISGQPVGVRVEEEHVTRGELNGHISRIEGDISEIKDSLEGERGIARLANGNLHKRIDALSERLGDRLSTLEGTTRAIETTTNKLLDIALGKKPPSAR